MLRFDAARERSLLRIVVGAADETGVDAPGSTTTRVPTFTRV